MLEELNCCKLCPHNCKVNRNKGEHGYCGAPNTLVVAKAYLHKWEEPCLSGTGGSGTIFFSYCNLRCIFCQNYEISTNNIGKPISVQRFGEICLELQAKGAHNINLVTPTHFVPLIKEGLTLAKRKGLTIPIIYNTNSYVNVSTLRQLKGLIDIYLPDLKYYDDELAIKYSKANNYFSCASAAVKEMYKQVGDASFDKDGPMIKGVIVRHLMLPTNMGDSKKIVKYLYDTYGDSIYMSLMNQYTPVREFKEQELNRVVSDNEYDELINYAYDLGVRKAFIQEGGTCSDSFIPKFDMEGV